MKETLKIGITFEYDQEENNNIPARIFLFQMINRLNYEYPVKEIEFKNKKIKVKSDKDIKELKLKKTNSI